MESILKLNLQSDSEKAEAAGNLPSQERMEEPPQQEPPHSKRFSKFVSRTAHKAATRSGGGGMFTK